MQWKGMKTGLTTIRENFTRYTISRRVGHVVLEIFSILQFLRWLEIGMSNKTPHKREAFKIERNHQKTKTKSLKINH